MAGNRRVFYAVQKIGISPRGSVAYTSVRGGQSVGITTNFNLESVFELGMSEIYENIETIPSVEVSVNKVLDGYCPVYLLATQGATFPTLISRGGCDPCHIVLGVYSDQQNSASGTVVTAVEMSGMYVNSVVYRVSTDGNATEETSFLGNNKIWTASNPSITDTVGPGGFTLSADNDLPMAIGGSGGVNRREDFILGTAVNKSRLPTQLPGVSSSGYISIASDGSYPIHITNMSVSANFGREDMFELGRRGAYYKFARTPIEVTTEIGIHSTSGDMISLTEEGYYGSGYNKYNLVDQTIVMRMAEGLVIDCGTKNKLLTIGLTGGDTGGDTGGANQAVTYTYRTYNDMSVYHPQDPNAANASFIPTNGWN